MDNNVLGVICARGGSKGLPRKNLADLFGKPLIWYSIQQAAGAEMLSRVLISTDCPEIACVVQEYVPHWLWFLRPSELATDNAKIDGAVIHALTFAEKKWQTVYDYVVVLPNSSPLRTSVDIDACVRLLVEAGSEADAVMSVVEIEHPYELMRATCGFITQLPEYRGVYRRQDCRSLYCVNGAVRVVRRNFLMNTGSMYGGNTLPYVMPQYRSLEIHKEGDLLIAEAFLGGSLCQH